MSHYAVLVSILSSLIDYDYVVPTSCSSFSFKCAQNNSITNNNTNIFCYVEKNERIFHYMVQKALPP